MTMDWLDKEGRPISTEEWGRLKEDEDYHRVGLDQVGPYMVSTVWLGLDHQFMPGGPPLIFETMVFTTTAWNADRSEEDHEGLLDLDCVRYSTEHEARVGHRDMVTLIRATYVEDPYETPSEASTDPEK